MRFLFRDAVVELGEMSTPTSSSHNLGEIVENSEEKSAENSVLPKNVTEGEVNPTFVIEGHEDTPC